MNEYEGMRVRMQQMADEPPRILIFSIEEFFFLIMCMAVGGLFDLMLPGMILGLAIGKIFRKLQEGAMPGLLLHLGWWLGIITFKGNFPIGLVREINQL